MISKRNRISAVQARLDDLLAGKPQGKVAPTSENTRLFSAFTQEDAQRAEILAALCSKIVDEVGGVQGLEQAVDKLYSKLENSPLGLVQRAAKLFLTHCKGAREALQMRNLEERQPGAVQPSLSP